MKTEKLIDRQITIYVYNQREGLTNRQASIQTDEHAFIIKEIISRQEK